MGAMERFMAPVPGRGATAVVINATGGGGRGKGGGAGAVSAKHGSASTFSAIIPGTAGQQRKNKLAQARPSMNGSTFISATMYPTTAPAENEMEVISLSTPLHFFE